MYNSDIFKYPIIKINISENRWELNRNGYSYAYVVASYFYGIYNY